MSAKIVTGTEYRPTMKEGPMGRPRSYDRKVKAPITASQHDALYALATSEGVTLAEVVRRAIDAYVHPQRRTRKRRAA
jgi:hypothetical protein